MRRRPDGSTTDVTPAGMNARDRVHEYGGASYVVDRGRLVFSNWADGRLWAMAPDDKARPITPEGAFRYADMVVDRARGRLICVREDHSGPGEAVNTIVAVPLDGSGTVDVLAEGRTFYSSPRLSPDGSQLVWLSWDHPNMPWDGTDLWLAALDSDGRPRRPEHVAGSTAEWTSQPRWSPDGILHFVNERTGWMQLYRRVDGRDELLTPIEAEFAPPDWQFGSATYAFMGANRILAVGRSRGADRLWSIDPAGPATSPLEVPFTEIRHLVADPRRVVMIAAGPRESASVVEMDTGSGALTQLRASAETPLEPADVSVPRPVEFPTAGGRTAHGLFYAPQNGRHEAPPGERPPLVVTSHGGPTGSASSALSTLTQLFTSRGIAVLDVDYGGSTGYGREYRKRLEGAWGITDVEDCANGALDLARRGLVDIDRIAIRGSSAGGFTTSAPSPSATTSRPASAITGSAISRRWQPTTHKFESRYMDRLVGPYPERRDLYRERSPLNFTERIACPVLILQGLDDRVVPPVQAEQIVAALAARGVPHAYLAFEGEDHGFRVAANIIRSFEAELSFYGQVFGFTPADAIEPVTLVR